MSVDALYDELGPRARARVRAATVASAAVLLALTVVALRRFAAHDQFEADLWRPFTDVRVIRFLRDGLWVTLRLAAAGMVLALAFGALLAFGRLARLRLVRLLSGAVVEVLRAVPLLLLIYFVARGLDRQGIDFPGFWQVVVALTAYNGAVIAEIIRAGVLSLDRGQSEAAYSIGLTYPQAMAYVVMPQAVRRMLPALVSQLVTLIKDTSLAYVIPLLELTRRGQIVGEEFTNLLPAYVVIAVVYIAICYSLSRFARWLEARQRRRYGGTVHVSGVEDLAVLEGASVAAAKADES